jgi:Outer membrane lipoprotein carrier protein LolA-like
VIGLAVVGVVAAAPSGSFDVEAAMRALAAAPKTPLAFTETRHSSLLKEPLVTTGELRFSPPDTLERRVRTPTAERYLIEGDRLTIERTGAGAPRTLSLASQPLLDNLVDTIRAMLRGDLPTLARMYRIEFAGGRDDWALTLLPSDPTMVEFVSTVRVTGHAGMLDEMEVVEPNGDRTVTRFTRVHEESR